MLAAHSERGPALVGLRRKSIWNPSAVDDVIRRGVEAARGIDRALPILHDGQIVAWAQGRQGSTDVMWRPHDKLHAAFTTYDSIINAISNAGKEYDRTWSKAHTTAPVANNWMDLWPVGGDPVSGSYPGAARTAVQWTDTSTGAMFMGGNVSTDNKHLTTMFALATAGVPPPTLMLYDRVLTYEACAFVAGNQTMTNTLPAQRYISAGQSGLKIAVTGQTVLGATAAAFTQLRYTDQDGNALQIMPVVANVNVIVSAAAPTATLGARVVSPSVAAATLPVGPFMPLAAGDGGVRLINDYTMSAANTGTLAFVLLQPLAYIPLQLAGQGVLIDMVMQLAGLERIYDGACLAFMAYFPAATGATLTGRVECAWG